MKQVKYFPPGDIPLCPGRDEIPQRHNVRLRAKPRKIMDMGIRQLNQQQRDALKNYGNLGATPDVKKDAAVAAGYSKPYAAKAMDKLLQRRPIVTALEEAGVTDKKIASVIVEGLESEHPLKPGRKDPHAIHKFVQEVNKVKGNYAPTKIQTEGKSQVMVVHLTAGNIEAFDKFKRMREEG